MSVLGLAPTSTDAGTTDMLPVLGDAEFLALARIMQSDARIHLSGAAASSRSASRCSSAARSRGAEASLALTRATTLLMRSAVAGFST